MRRIRSGKTLSLGMPKAPQGNIQGRLKHLSLGMGWHPLFRLQHYRYTSLGTIFLFIIICVLLGASFLFQICFCYSIMFCISIKVSSIAFTMLSFVYELLFQNRKFSLLSEYS